MKTFEELKNKMTLKPRAGDECELGTMYFDPAATRNTITIIRHLDNKLTVEMLPVYVHLYHSIQQWIANHPEINQCVFMPDLIEVGEDYFIRPFHVYHVSTYRYFEEGEDYLEPEEEYEPMIEAVTKELGTASDQEGVISKVLRRSLLEPTGKTFFKSRLGKYVIVEPKVTIADIEQWKQEHFSN
jgi:hypothetical protein